MASTGITVHDWLRSFCVDEARPIPSNCTFHNLRYYARTRFGYRMVQRDNTIVRVAVSYSTYPRAIGPIY